jgi:hypothetical protein
MTTTPAATSMGRRLMRGDTYEYECRRTTTRMTTALALLKSQGVEATVTHSDRTEFDWATHRERHLCDPTGSNPCVTEWPGWVTGPMFDMAYNLACEMVGARGRYNRTSRPAPAVASA